VIGSRDAGDQRWRIEALGVEPQVRDARRDPLVSGVEHASMPETSAGTYRLAVEGTDGTHLSTYVAPELDVILVLMIVGARAYPRVVN
jgi:hypothetical protein